VSSSLRRGALAAAAIAFSIASLSACAAGHNAQTLEIQPDNASATVGDIKVQNATVITQPDLESTGPAVVSATLFNEGRTDQTLESVTVPGTGKTAELTPAEGGSLTVPAGGSLILGGEGNAAAVLPSSREAVRDGNAQKITFTFSKTGDVSLRAIVFPAEHFFEEWGPTEAAAAPGASTEPSTDPSAESSGEPADDTTDEATGAPEDTENGENTENGESTETDASSGTPTDAASASAQTGH
jgi:copper(I)-binding protein